MLVFDVELFLRPQIVLYLTENTFCLSDEDQSCTAVAYVRVCLPSHCRRSQNLSYNLAKDPNVQFHKISSAGSSHDILCVACVDGRTDRQTDRRAEANGRFWGRENNYRRGKHSCSLNYWIMSSLNCWVMGTLNYWIRVTLNYWIMGTFNYWTMNTFNY
jgi:hypothetical protein